MMKLSTKIIITVAVLMFSAVQSYASETCAADVNTCTPKQLWLLPAISLSGKADI